MNLVLTMAGRYSRFVDEGYRIPKYLLPWGDKSIMSEIIDHLNQDDFFENIFLIANKRDVIFMPHVKKILKNKGISSKHLILIEDTSGQAETAFHAIREITANIGSLEGGIVFHNIDTILYKRDLSSLLDKLSSNMGYIDIFKSNNRNYSYVLVKDDRVQSIAEKIVISNNASSGLYGFSNKDHFLKYYDKNIMYFSNLYKKMIDAGESISVSELHNEKDTIVLGTPSDYLTSSYVLDLEG